VFQRAAELRALYSAVFSAQGKSCNPHDIKQQSVAPLCSLDRLIRQWHSTHI
jgi:hypothetical protein